MKQKEIKQNISLVVTLSLKEALTHLAGKQRLTLSQYCAKILREYIDVKGMGKSFKDIEDVGYEPPKPRPTTPAEEARFEKLTQEVDELIDMLPDLPNK